MVLLSWKLFKNRTFVTSTDQLSVEERRERLDALTRQQIALADFGQSALELGDVSELCDQAVNVVAGILNVPRVLILQKSRTEYTFSTRATLGWPGLVPEAGVTLDEITAPASFATKQHQTIIVEDFDAEHRFPVSTEGSETTSVIVSIIGRRSSPFGALAVHSIDHRVFADDEIRFVQSIANLLGGLITRTRQREALLEEREASQDLMNSLGQGIIAVDREMRIEYVNVIMAEMLGMRRRDILDSSPVELVVESERGKVFDAFDGRKRGERDYYEATMMHVDGSHVHVMISGSPRFRHGEFVGSSMVVTNISDIKDVEASLRASEEQFRLLFELAPIGMAIVSLDGTYEQVNEAFARIAGYEREELVGMHYVDLSYPEDIEEGIGTFDPGLEREMRLMRKDGQLASVVIHAALMHSHDGQPQHYLAQIVDVTEKKRLEDQFRQSQKMEAIGRLAGGIAHDFNNILTAIIGYTEMIKARISDDSDKILSSAEQIDQAAQRAAMLTGQLLAFSRQQVLQPQIIDLNKLVRGITAILRRVIGEHIEFRTRLAPDLAAVRADPSQIEQVIMNLVINARDAMVGGGLLIVETANVSVDEPGGGVAPGSYVMLSISDTGEGISDDVIENIFDPFFTTKAQGVGTGLGLATVHGIVSQSSGTVRVDSEMGKGSTFLVYLPCSEDAIRVEQAEEEPGALPAGQSGRILLVEDEEIVADLARLLLEGAGYTVVTAASATEAAIVFEGDAGDFDLLISDVILPGGRNGPELAAELQQQAVNLKILFTSGYTDNSLDDDVEFLPKPFTSRLLLEKVAEILKTRARV
jgi:PAS domain S-box-containing protein